MPPKKKFDVLQIKRVPDPPKAGRRFLVGRSGFTLREVWVMIFEANEALPKNRKLTDEAITQKVIYEFDGLQAKNRKGLRTISEILRTGAETINRYRSLYNSGKFTGGKRPKPRSRRYDFKGNVIDAFGRPL